MSENGGLEIPLGVTLAALTKQLAQAEARMNRTAQKGEALFVKSNRGISRSIDQVTRSSQGLTGGNGLRMVALQLNQVGQQGAVTGDYLRALSIQMPDLLLAFGTFGALAGTAVGVLAPFAMSLFNAEEGVSKLVASLTGGQVGLDSARGSMEQLRNIQDDYTRAIEASAVASDGTAAVVVASSQREFAARKAVLEQELRLLRLRARQQDIDAASLPIAIAQEAAEGRRRTGTPAMYPGVSLGADGDRGRLSQVRDYVNVAPRTSADVPGLENFYLNTDPQSIALEKLRAEAELTQLAIEETATALNTEFATIASGASGAAGAASGGGAAGGGGGGGGGRGSRGGGAAGAVSQVRVEVEGLAGSVAGLSLESDRMRGSFSTAFASIITGASSAREALAQMLAQFGGGLASAAGGNLFDLLGSTLAGGAFAKGAAFSGGRVTAFAKGGVVSGPTLFPMARGMGLMGEAGPEAVMPLARGPGGRLGVVAQGGGGTVINYAPVIDARGADLAAVARIERALAEDRASFEGRVAGVNRRASRSGAADAWGG